MVKDKLTSFRKEIDLIDTEIFELLEERFEIVEKIGDYKIKNKLAIEDKKREKVMIKNKTQMSGLPQNFVKKLLTLIMDESKRIQRSKLK